MLPYLTTGRYPPAYGRPIDGRVVLGPEVGWGGGGGRAALCGGCRGGGSGGGGAGGLRGGLAQDVQQQQAGQQQRHCCLVVSYNQNKQMFTKKSSEISNVSDSVADPDVFEPLDPDPDPVVRSL
jgi:hypothetical protein